MSMSKGSREAVSCRTKGEVGWVNRNMVVDDDLYLCEVEKRLSKTAAMLYGLLAETSEPLLTPFLSAHRFDRKQDW
jgi:hypothetical protein